MFINIVIVSIKNSTFLKPERYSKDGIAHLNN